MEERTGKMKKNMKKIVSVLLALAMVITGLNYTPTTVRAAEGDLPTSQEVTELKAPKKTYLCDFRMSDGKYKIVFTDADEENFTVVPGDTKSFDIYVGNQKRATVSESGEAVDISTWGFVDGQVYEITVKQVLKRAGKDTLESKASAVNYFTYTAAKTEVIDTGVAKIFVNTTRDADTRTWDLLKSGIKQDVKAALVVQNTDGSVNVANSGTIKLRGNSTSTGQKKPYNIKFDSKENVFKFGKAKKWSLLANTFDKSLIRNQVGVQFHHSIMEANQEYQYTSESKPVDFYLDGKYLGAYLLLESVEAGSSRVDIDAENPDNHEILLELDTTDRDLAEDAHLDYHTTIMNLSFTINEPGGPGTHGENPNDPDHQEWLEFNKTYAAKKEYTLNYLNHFEELIQGGGDGTLDEIGKIIDVDSFVNYYITAELFRITDVGFSSVRFFIKNENGGAGAEKLYAGPLWDLDLSSGNADGAAANPDNDMHAQDNPWFGHLMKNKEFRARVTERFNEVLPDVKDIVADGGRIDRAVNEIKKSAEANYSPKAYNVYELNGNGTTNGWAINKLYTAGGGAYATEEEARASGSVSGSLVIHNTWQEYVNDFKSYMTGRIKYLKTQFDATDYDEELTDIADQMGSYVYNLAKNKKSTLYKNCHQEGRQEYLNDGQLMNGVCPLTNADVINSWGTENKPVYATIDLGKYYNAQTIDKVVVQYKDGADNDTVLNRPYSIQYSTDGKNFREVASTEKAVLDANNRTIDDVSSVEGTVRFVRLYFPKQAGYGMQIREFAVLDTDKNATAVESEEVADITNLLLTSPDDNRIGVLFDASTTKDVTYQIYVDGDLVMDEAVAGKVNIINNIKIGKHTVMVQAMNPNGFVSEGVSDVVTVIGPPDAQTMVNNPKYNIAYKTTATYSSWKEGSNNNTLTDGVISNHDSYEGIHVDGQHNNTGYFQINLSNTVNAKSIDEVHVWYRDGRAMLAPINIGYSIQYSEDGETFYTVKTVSAADMPLEGRENADLAYETLADMSDIASPVSRVKAIRVLYNGEVGWGVQAREIAVFDKKGNAGADREEEKVEEPIVTITASAAYSITADIAAAAGQEDYTYTIYVDGNAEYTNVPAGKYVVSNMTEGTHMVTVRSNYNKLHSNGVSKSVEVKSGSKYESSTLAGRLLPDSNENGKNYARYTGVSAYGSTGEGSYAIDNKADTRWESEHSDPQDIIVDLGEVYTVKEIAAVWEAANSRDFSVEVSLDGMNFEKVSVIKNAKAGADRYDRIILTEATQARQVKICGTARNLNYGHSIWEMAVYGSDEQKEYVPIFGPARRASVESYARYTGKYFVMFKENELAVSYNIYIDDKLVSNIAGAGYYITADELKGISEGEHTLSVVSVSKDGFEATPAKTTINVESASTANNDIPQIYISTQGRDISGEYFAKKDDGRTEVNVAVIDNTGEYDDVIDCMSDIKIRGNTTAGGEKKPYNFKLNKKKELLGMKGKAKKWSLLANAFDKALMRNALVMQFASEIGLDYISECRFVDVYVNGNYSGNYLLIESIDVGDGRVEIEAEDETSNDALMEIDNNGRDTAETFHLDKTPLGVWLMLGSPEFGPDETDQIELYRNKIDHTQQLLAEFEAALLTNDIDEVAKYIDIDSFAKFYIVNELFRNQDINFSSTRFYVKNEVLYAGPCWDYDLSSGNIGQYYSGDYKDGVTYNTGKVQELVWYRYLMKNKAFRDLVIKYYYQYLPQIQALFDGTMADTGYGIDGILNKYRTAFERNYASEEELGAGWNITEPDPADGFSYANNREWETFDDAVEFLRDWLIHRDEWMQSEWQSAFISNDIAVTGYQMTTSLRGELGKVGIRTVYQKEPLVENYEVTEFGLVYGLDNGQITDNDMMITSDSEYVVHMAATEAGKYEIQMGDSATAEYYVRTMDTAANYTQNYKVRAYAILSDGSTVYSKVSSYNVYNVAQRLYESNKMPNYQAHNRLHEYVISQVEPEYEIVDYNWNQTLVNRTESKDDLKIEGYQMTGTLTGIEGKMGLKVVYSADNDVRDNAEEVGLVYGLVYGNTPITADDMTLDTEAAGHPFVKSYAATSQGVMDFKMGSSSTAVYYARTMNVTGLNAEGYTVGYMVRAYAKMNDGTVVYSDVCTYSIADVASNLYDNDLMSTFYGHNALYNNILKVVNVDYKEVDYNWTNTIAR